MTSQRSARVSRVGIVLTDVIGAYTRSESMKREVDPNGPVFEGDARWVSELGSTAPWQSRTSREGALSTRRREAFGWGGLGAGDYGRVPIYFAPSYRIFAAL